jgi:hypothetical protein
MSTRPTSDVLRETLLLRVSWGPRADDPASCARRWSRTNALLAGVDPALFSRWYQATGPEPDDLVPLTDPVVMEASVRAGVVQGDGKASPELGFSFAASNGQTGDLAAVFNAHAGLTQTRTSQVNTARVRVELKSEAHLERWLSLAEGVLTALVTAWEPDAGAAWTMPVFRAQGVPPSHPIAGYVTYLSPGRCTRLPGDIDGEWRSTPDGGLISSLVHEAGHLPTVADVAALGQQLRLVGALDPSPRDRPRL